MSRHRRSRLLPSLALALGAVLAVTGVGVVPGTSLASWTDAEFAAGGLGALDCTSALDSQASGRMLRGSVLGLDLDAVAELSGAEAAGPAASQQANPLQVTALDALDLPLGDVLQLGLGTDTGAVGQFAAVDGAGLARGAAGLIDDEGAIELVDDGDQDGGEGFATLDLAELLASLELPSLEALASAQLELGALASAASVEGCSDAWQGTESLARSAVVSSLDAVLTAPAVAAGGALAATAVGGVQSAIDATIGAQSVHAGVASAVAALLNGVLGLLSLGDVGVQTLSVAVDLGEVLLLLEEPRSDPDGVLTVDFGSGTVGLDLLALLGEPYSEDASALNGLPPNTELLLDETVLTALSGRLVGVLDGWIAALVGAVGQAVLDATVDVEMSLRLRTLILEVADLQVSIQGARLGDLAATQAQVQINLLGTCPNPNAPLAGLNLFCTIGSLLGTIVGVLTTGTGGAVSGVVRPLLIGTGAAAQPISTALSLVAASDALGFALAGVASALDGLLGEGGALSILANVRNGEPGAPSGAGWADLPPGRFDVAALRITALAAAFELDLARSSVRSVVADP